LPAPDSFSLLRERGQFCSRAQATAERRSRYVPRWALFAGAHPAQLLIEGLVLCIMAGAAGLC
jgi:hypothetical protein